jgi:CspA family cold shock protein
MRVMSRKFGKVKFFNPKKGYGFIVSDVSDGGKDVFVHRNDLGKGVEERLSQGARVSFVIGTNRNKKGNGKIALAVKAH